MEEQCKGITLEFRSSRVMDNQNLGSKILA
jgi:hypothetical protein